MGFFDNWPYTDFHRLNLDWVLEQMRGLRGDFVNLENFVKDPGRFLPKLADPLEWTQSKSYNQYYIVTYRGNSYMARVDVPIGTPIDNEDYWVKVAEFSGQVAALESRLDQESDIVSAHGQHLTALDEAKNSQALALDALNTRVGACESNISDLKSKGTDPITGKRLLFIGDSYLQGYKANGVNWGEVLAGMGSPEGTSTYAEGGAGFATAGQQGHTFAQLVGSAASALENVPDIVIVCGGINDVHSKTPSQIAEGVTAMLGAIFAAWPNAQVHIFMPFTFWGWGGNYEESSDAIQIACATYDTAKRVAYHAGAWTWLYNRPAYFDADEVHPTAAGQRVIANCIFNELSGNDQTVYHDKWSQGAVSVERNYVNLQINIAAPTGSEYAQGATIASLPKAFGLFFSIVPCWSSSGTAYVKNEGNTITLYSDAANGLYGSYTSAMSGGF